MTYLNVNIKKFWKTRSEKAKQLLKTNQFLKKCWVFTKSWLYFWLFKICADKNYDWEIDMQKLSMHSEWLWLQGTYFFQSENWEEKKYLIRDTGWITVTILSMQKYPKKPFTGLITFFQQDFNHIFLFLQKLKSWV